MQEKSYLFLLYIRELNPLHRYNLPGTQVAWYLLVIDSRRATASSRIFTGDDLKKKKLE